MNFYPYLTARISIGFLVTVVFAIGFAVASDQPPRGPDCRATELLPSSVVAYAEINDLGKTLQMLLDHPLRSRLEALPAYQAYSESDERAQLQIAINAFEGGMGQSWHAALGTLTDRGISIALDGTDGGLAILLQSTDDQALERLRGFILAAQLLQGKPTKEVEYRGFRANELDNNVKMTRLHDWLLLTNNSELGKSIIDQYIDRAADSFDTNSAYRAAMADQNSTGLLQLFIDMQAVREIAADQEIFDEKVENMLAEVLLGGVLSDLRQTPHVLAELNVDELGLAAHIEMPHDREWESPREYYFGESQLASAPELLQVDDQLFALSAHRDLSQMWLRAGDLVSDQAVDQLAMADTQLTTLFSGRDFGEDILGSLESDIQIVVANQEFENVLPQPAIKLPSFAFQFQMKNPSETQPELRRVFQSLIGFLNVVGSMEGQPQLDMMMENVAGDNGQSAQLVTANYVPERDRRESRDAPIQFNFSPTLAFVSNRVLVSSSAGLARELILAGDTTTSSENEVTDSTRNTTVELMAASLQRILQSNRSQLIANSMLEKGHSKEAAEGEIGLLIELVGFFDDVSAALTINESGMAIDTAIRFVSEMGDVDGLELSGE